MDVRKRDILAELRGAGKTGSVCCLKMPDLFLMAETDDFAS
jgi:hypothetical protein